jgi:hypothetical protein
MKSDVSPGVPAGVHCVVYEQSPSLVNAVLWFSGWTYCMANKKFWCTTSYAKPPPPRALLVFIMCNNKTKQRPAANHQMPTFRRRTSRTSLAPSGSCCRRKHKQKTLRPLPRRLQFADAAAHTKAAVHTDATSTRGWGRACPRGDERRRLPSGCFLLPEQRKYPVCNAHGEVDRRGLIAAHARARSVDKRARRGAIAPPAYDAQAVADTARKIAATRGCAWPSTR